MKDMICWIVKSQPADSKVKFYIYFNTEFQQIFYSPKTGSKKTNLNKLNQRATCLQISEHGGRVEHWVEQN